MKSTLNLLDQNNQFQNFYSYSFLLAAMSVLYEFVMAQFLTVFHGGTVEIYFMTIGIYSFFLGVGAFWYDFICSSNNFSKKFANVELLLVLTVVSSPFIILFSGGIEIKALSYFVGFLPLVVMSFCSGVELPYLLSLARDKNQKTKVIMLDFIGMCFGGLLFAFVLITKFSLIENIGLCLIINSLVMFYFSYKNRLKKHLLLYVFMFVLTVSFIVFDGFIL